MRCELKMERMMTVLSLVKKVKLVSPNFCFARMYLPSTGFHRDRTVDLMRFRGTTVTPHNKDEFNDSTLEIFFNKSSDIKADLSRASANFDILVRKQQESLRPTFTESDIFNETTKLSNSINSDLESILNRINSINYDNSINSHNKNINIVDRQQILKNIQANLLDLYRTFSFKFRASQQAYSVNYSTQHSNIDQNHIEFENIKQINYEYDQIQEQEHHDAELAEIARRAEEIRHIFLELQNLIIDQGSVIDRIDFCVNESLNNAESAHSHIEQAYKYQKKSRMWKCAIFLGIFVFLLIIVALLK